MSRPAPQVHLERRVANVLEQIILCDALFCIYYSGSPILRRAESIKDSSHRYNKKSVYATKAKAFAAAKYLNTLFRTDQFSVVKVGVKTTNTGTTKS